MQRTVKDDLCLADRTLDVYGRLFGFRSDVAARGGDEGGVGFAVRVAEVEPPEVDDGRRDHLLAEVQPLADLLHGCPAGAR